MWHFSKRGFTSTVAYDPAKNRDPKSRLSEFAPQAGTHVLVRARIKEDLDDLKRVVPDLHVETDPSADYSFRCVVSREDLKAYLALSVDDIDYDSHFKEACRDAAPKAGGRYSAMMSVWSAMARIQPHTPYGNWWGSTSTKTTSTKTTVKDSPKAPVSKFEVGDKAPVSKFEVGDKVSGTFGSGTVVGTRPGYKGYQILEISTDKGVEHFHSAYVSLGAALSVQQFAAKLIEAWDKGLSLEDVAPQSLGPNEEDAWDLYCEVSEELGNELPDTTRLNLAFDRAKFVEFVNARAEEITWDSASAAEKLELAQSGAVPPKAEAEAIRLLTK